MSPSQDYSLTQRSGTHSGGRYRALSSGSTVDESLFACKSKRTTKSKPKNNKKVEAELGPSSVILTKAELEKIRIRSILKTEAEIQYEKEANDKILQQKKAAAKSRKEKMLALAEDAKKKTQKTDIEIENQARDETLRQLAQEKINNNLDLVKHLKGLAAQAEAFTIRDTQLKDKDNKYAKEKEYNDEMDELMELERVKDIERREAEELAKLKQRIVDREVIVSQIKDRAHQKIIEEEAREQEGLAMLALLKKYEQDDHKNFLKRLEEIKKMRKEVLIANEKAIQARRDVKLKEKEEVQAIIEYQIKKDAEMKAREDEEMARELAKKARQAELLAQQERAQNNQSELDELRARRAAEQKERAARTREKEEGLKRRANTIKLREDLFKQAELKKAMQAKEAALQQAEHDHAVRYNTQVYERERAEEERKEKGNKEHLIALKQQVADAEARRCKERADKFEVGRHLKQEAAAERARLETIRDHMIRDMEKKGINPKYLGEMKRTDIAKLQHM